MTLGQLREQLAALDLPEDTEVVVDEVYSGRLFPAEGIEVWEEAPLVRIKAPSIGEYMFEEWQERERNEGRSRKED